MSNKKWFIICVTTVLILLIAVVSLNLRTDTYGVRMSLFNWENKKLSDYQNYPGGLNQHIFNPEFIFQNPNRFDAFLFGSSRVAVINVSGLPGGRFFNMSYSEGLPGEHLRVIRHFLEKGLPVQSVLIGLEEVSFRMSATVHEDQLLRIMHPDIGSTPRPKLFFLYFFRLPEKFELSALRKSILKRQEPVRLRFDDSGRTLSWVALDEIVERAGRPVFVFETRNYEPVAYPPDTMQEGLDVVREIMRLSEKHQFTVTFFLNPIYADYYINYADGLIAVKERLAEITDFYDFSGFNSVTTDIMNYYEESHYRYRVGDMIINRIYGIGPLKAPKDFGFFVTQQNVAQHVEKQKQELKRYLQTRKP